MDVKKIIGFSLLGLGILIILWSLYSSYAIFTAKKPAPEVFKSADKSAVSAAPSSEDKTGFSQADIQRNVENMVGEKIKEVIPPEFLTKILNLTSWSILAAIFIFGGSKISGLGIRLLKDSR